MKITLRSPYKVKEYHFQPLKGKNGMNLPFVKKVRYDHNGNSEMILSEAERNDPNSAYFIPEDMDIVVTEGTTFDLDNPYEANLWNAIKDSELIAPTRDSRDANGDLIIDVSKIDGDCLSESTCTVDDNISILVTAGIGNQTEDYNISNNGEYTKINGTNNYLKLDVNIGDLII